ncbi:MAG TPA: TonB family protein [Sphingobium sp.]
MSNRIQKSGYQSQNRLSPAAIGGVLLIHAGLGAAILTMTAVTVFNPKEPVIWAWNIPKSIPKPTPELQEFKPDARNQRIPSTHAELPLRRTPEADAYPQLTTAPTIPGDTGTGPVIDPIRPAEPPQPVLVQARPDARFASGFQPPYPAAMLRQQMEGAVTVRITIGPDGRVLDVVLVNTPDPAFFEATRRQALNRWRFIPAMRDGVAITSERVMTVRFRLTD